MCGCEDNARPKSPGGGRVESLRGALIRGGWRKSSVNIIDVLLLGGKNSTNFDAPHCHDIIFAKSLQPSL